MDRWSRRENCARRSDGGTREIATEPLANLYGPAVAQSFRGLLCGTSEILVFRCSGVLDYTGHVGEVQFSPIDGKRGKKLGKCSANDLEPLETTTRVVSIGQW